MGPGITPFEHKLCEEVRKYKHLYDLSARDVQMTNNSWREVAKALRSDENSVKKQWQNMRSRFVKASKKHTGTAGVKTPAILKCLSWLETYIRRRETAFENVSCVENFVKFILCIYNCNTNSKFKGTMCGISEVSGHLMHILLLKPLERYGVCMSHTIQRVRRVMSVCSCCRKQNFKLREGDPLGTTHQ